jgi:hypothetical protein
MGYTFLQWYTVLGTDAMGEEVVGGAGLVLEEVVDDHGR